VSFTLIAFDQVCSSQSKWPLTGWRTHFLYCIDMHECFTGKYTTHKIHTKLHLEPELCIFHLTLRISVDFSPVRILMMSILAFPYNYVAVCCKHKRKLHNNLKLLLLFYHVEKNTLLSHCICSWKKYYILLLPLKKKFISLCCQRVSFICYN